MKRYYTCDIIGDGSEFNPFRPAVADYGVNYVAEIQTDPDTGRPLKPFALVFVEAKNHGQLVKDARVDFLPDFPLDGKISAMHSAAKAALSDVLAKREIPTDLLSTSDGYREAIRGIGRVLNQNFHEDNFDISE